LNADPRDLDAAVVRELDQFDASSGSLLERLLFNRRALIVALCLLATLALGWQALGLRLNAAFEKMLPQRHPYIANYLQHKAQLPGLGNTLRIAVEARGGTIFDAAYLEALRKINDEVFLLPGVDRPYMKSLWSPATRWTGVTEDGLDGGPVIADDYDGSARSIEQVRANVERSGEVGQLVAPDFRSSVVLVPIQEADAGGRLDYRALARRLDDLRQAHESDRVKIHVTGFAQLVGDLMAGLQQMAWFFAAALAICSAVLFGYTRCARSTLLVMACSLAAVVWLLGGLRLLRIDLDPYSILVPFLIFAIGMSHGAQKMNGILQDIGRGTHKLVAARHTFRRLFLAGLTALLADAVGFAVLMAIDIPVIQDLALTASLGVAVLIFTNLVLLPILLSYTGVSAAAARRSLSAQEGRHAMWSWLDRFTERRWAVATIAVALLLGAAAFAASLRLQVGDTNPGAPELRPDSRYNRDNAFMVAHYGASSDAYVVMVETPKFGCSAYATVVAVDALERELRQLDGVIATSSLAGMSRHASAAMNEGSLKWFDIPRSQDMLNAVVARAPRELVTQGCDLLTLNVFLADHQAGTLERVVQSVERFAQAHDGNGVRFLSAAGNAGIEAATNIVVKDANLRMLLMVYAAVVVLCFVTFRSWRAVVCAVVPLLLTSVLCEALMVLLGIGVKVATLPVIALGVGIGVDYALYVLTVTLRHLRAGEPLAEAFGRALAFTGKVVVLTGLTLGVAVATWAFSPIKFQADMGILLAFMFVWNMLGALVLMPALAHFLLRPMASREPPPSKRLWRLPARRRTPRPRGSGAPAPSSLRTGWRSCAHGLRIRARQAAD